VGRNSGIIYFENQGGIRRTTLGRILSWFFF